MTNIKVSKTCSEIIGGIIYDLENNNSYEDIVKHTIKYIMDKYDIDKFKSGSISLEKDDNDIKITIAADKGE